MVHDGSFPFSCLNISECKMPYKGMTYKLEERDVRSVFTQGKAQELEQTASLLCSTSFGSLAKVWKLPLISPGSHPRKGPKPPSSFSQHADPVQQTRLLSPAIRQHLHCGRRLLDVVLLLSQGVNGKHFQKAWGNKREKAPVLLLLSFFFSPKCS